MKKTHSSYEQLVFALEQAELDTPRSEVCLKMGVSDATFYTWCKKFGGLAPSVVRRLKQLEAENDRLKKLVAGLSLNKSITLGCICKKL